MTTKRSHVFFIKDIIRAIEKIERFVDNMSFGEFTSNEIVRDAVVWNLTVIGESSKNIPAQVKRRYRDIPWSAMAKMRDRLAHGHFAIDYEIVWKVIKEELPPIKKQNEKNA